MRLCLHVAVLIAFGLNTLMFMPIAQADPAFGGAGDFRLPVPGVMIRLSPSFNSSVLKGIKVHPENPLKFDFILDQGDDRQPLKQEANKLIKYFLASLTIPEKDLWVNLSPYEKDRIFPQSFFLTEMGRDLLAQDYMLKQITASLIYPEGEVGKSFWKRIYAEAAQKFGTTDITVNTFNKVWIVPQKAVVYENVKAGTAYVVESKLKVMLEQDYLAIEKSSLTPASLRGAEGDVAISKRTTNVREIASSLKNASRNDDVNTLGSQIVREIVIPQLTQEINENKNFTQLRQVYNSLILATWYKKKIKDSILSQVFADKNKVSGLLSSSLPGKEALKVKATQRNEPNDIELIYQRYLQAFKKGAYNYIKEEIDPATQQTIPRKYFSGGMDFAMNATGAVGISHLLDIVNSPDSVLTAQASLFQASVNLTALQVGLGTAGIVAATLGAQWVFNKWVGPYIRGETRQNARGTIDIMIEDLLEKAEVNGQRLLLTYSSRSEKEQIIKSLKKQNTGYSEIVRKHNGSLNIPIKEGNYVFIASTNISLHPDDESPSLLNVLGLKRRNGNHYTNITDVLLAQLESFEGVDHLTGIPGRASAEPLFVELMKRRNGKKAVIVMDLDHFKRFNDDYSHGVGDLVLKEFVNTIKGIIRAESGDAIVRYGGEEFVMFMPFNGTEEELKAVLERILKRIENEVYLKIPALKAAGQKVTVSAGAALIDIEINDQQRENPALSQWIRDRWTKIFNIADANLFESKDAGRNRVTVSVVPLHIDKAMIQVMEREINKEVGGIDLTPAKMDLQTTTGGQGYIQFLFDPAMLAQLQNAPGFVPVVVDVKPLHSLPEFLGIT